MEKKTLTSSDLREMFGKRIVGEIVRHEIRIPIREAVQLANMAKITKKSESEIITGMLRLEKDPAALLREEARDLCVRFAAINERLKVLSQMNEEVIEEEIFLPEVRA